MRTPRILWTLALLFTLLPVVSTAWSQPLPAGDVGAQADDHFRQGKVLLKSGKKREAREEYLTAFRLKPSHDVAGNLGNVELALGMPRDAAEHLSFALRHYAPTGSTPEQIETAKRRLLEAKHAIGTVRVTVNIAGAELLVDGVSVGRSPLDDALYVEPGTRTIAARLAGHTEAKEVLQAAKGSELAVVLTLSQSTPWAGTTPPVAPPVAQKRPLWPVVAGGVTAGVAALTGVVLLAVYGSMRADTYALRDSMLAEQHSCVEGSFNFDARCSDLASHSRLVYQLHDASMGVLVGAGVVAVGALAYGLWPASTAARSNALHVTPTWSATSGGLVFSGRF